MKEIKAVIQPGRLARLRDALRAEPGFRGMTVTEAQGCSAVEPAPPANHREELLDFSRKVRVELLVEDAHAEAMLRVIHRVAHTGQKGDGVAWVTDVGHSIRLRDP